MLVVLKQPCYFGASRLLTVRSKARRVLHLKVAKAMSSRDEAREGPKHDPVEMASAIIEEGKHYIGKLKDPDDIANKVLKEGARHMARKEAEQSPDHRVHKDGPAAEAMSIAARKDRPEPPEAAELVRGEIRAEYGTGPAEELAEAVVEAAWQRMERQPEEKRPHDVLGVLREGESELMKREARAQGHVEGGGLAAHAASAAERLAHGGHPKVADKVAEKLKEEGIVEGE